MISGIEAEFPSVHNIIASPFSDLCEFGLETADGLFVHNALKKAIVQINQPKYGALKHGVVATFIVVIVNLFVVTNIWIADVNIVKTLSVKRQEFIECWMRQA